MSRTLYPTLEEALYLHTQLIERFGGQAGVRDHGLLQSALARPQSGYYDSLSLQAASLMQSLVMNHAFLDGNKRLAFALTDVFLRLNGFRIVADAAKTESFLIEKVIQGRAEIDEIARWIEQHLKKH